MSVMSFWNSRSKNVAFIIVCDGGEHALERDACISRGRARERPRQLSGAPCASLVLPSRVDCPFPSSLRYASRFCPCVPHGPQRKARQETRQPVLTCLGPPIARTRPRRGGRSDTRTIRPHQRERAGGYSVASVSLGGTSEAGLERTQRHETHTIITSSEVYKCEQTRRMKG